MTEAGEVLQSATLHAVRVAASEDHEAASAPVSPLLGQQKVATQMHADKPG